MGDWSIPEGCRVFNLYGAGSHAPAVFDRPDEFVIDRVLQLAYDGPVGPRLS